MSIRLKIILVVLPLLIATLALTGVSSFFSATNAISRIAKEFLGFKALELENQASSQWSILVKNDYADKPEYVAGAKKSVKNYSLTILRSVTELIVAFNPDGAIGMSTADIQVLEGEKAVLAEQIKTKSSDFVTVWIGGRERVAKGFWFEPFSWYVLVTEERGTFYNQVNEIALRTGIILLAAIVAGIILILIFANYLTQPLTRVVNTMKDIISTNDLSERVVVEYRDEIGSLAQTFNLMVGELEKAYAQIKSFAFKAVLAQKRELKIRNIFQKYVPKDVIEGIFQNPEQMLVGESRILSVLFSDIRDFTTISEKMMPDDLVTSLNRYFTVMVDIIMSHGGIVDKYIGDAIMAFFGAPIKHADDALQSVLAGLEMVEALAIFNKTQKAAGKPTFNTGVGINYGVVTVGNIGSEKKMDYTVIGDMVNLASRLEGQTKSYHQPIIISESLHMKVKDTLPCRLLDCIAVKGKSQGQKIFAVKKTLDEIESQVWELHNTAMDAYYVRDFSKALGLFQNVQIIMPDDYVSGLLMQRCRAYEKNPPGADWNGVEKKESK
jgi:class 3 adenylate cyclase/HAMP domain-containing protein